MLDSGRRRDAAEAGYGDLQWAEAVGRGLRWCHRDQAFEPAEQFGRDRSRWDGLAGSCRRSMLAHRGRSPSG